MSFFSFSIFKLAGMNMDEEGRAKELAVLVAWIWMKRKGHMDELARGVGDMDMDKEGRWMKGDMDEGDLRVC